MLISGATVEKKRGYSSSPSSSTPKSGRQLIITQTVFQAQIFSKFMLMGHFGPINCVMEFLGSCSMQFVQCYIAAPIQLVVSIENPFNSTSMHLLTEFLTAPDVSLSSLTFFLLILFFELRSSFSFLSLSLEETYLQEGYWVFRGLRTQPS